MSAPNQIEWMQAHVARLRNRVERQSSHLEGLAEYPEVARRAAEVLAKDSEELRLALIALGQMCADQQNRTSEPDARAKTGTGSDAS